MMFSLKRKKKNIQISSSDFENMIKKYLNPNLTESLFVVDIGANRGDFFGEFCRIFHNNKIEGILVEPIPECYNILKERFSNFKNVVIFNNAISDINGNVKFYVNDYDETSSLLKIKKEMPELKSVNTELQSVLDLQALKLDDVLKNNISEIDLLKIDVQGTEHKVLDGAIESCKSIKYIWIEVSFKALYEGSSTFNEIYDKLLSLGFILLEISDGHRAPNNELLQANCLFKNRSI